MTASDTLVADLIARVEAAKGADREIDAIITELFDLPNCHEPDCLPDVLVRIIERVKLKGFGSMDSSVPFYTSSIDAALALVERKLTGIKHRIQIFGREEGWGCRLTYWPGMMTVSSYEFYEDEANPLRYQPTAPLAILVALLKAIQRR